jgi:hypothetical protein
MKRQNYIGTIWTQPMPLSLKDTLVARSFGSKKSGPKHSITQKCWKKSHRGKKMIAKTMYKNHVMLNYLRHPWRPVPLTLRRGALTDSKSGHLGAELSDMAWPVVTPSSHPQWFHWSSGKNTCILYNNVYSNMYIWLYIYDYIYIWWYIYIYDYICTCICTCI